MPETSYKTPMVAPNFEGHISTDDEAREEPWILA